MDTPTNLKHLGIAQEQAREVIVSGIRGYKNKKEERSPALLQATQEDPLCKSEK